LIADVDHFLWFLLAGVALTLVGFFFMVSSLLAFHIYLISKNLTTCMPLILTLCRGIPILDEDLLYESVA
jgi:hypothetical protein